MQWWRLAHATATCRVVQEADVRAPSLSDGPTGVPHVCWRPRRALGPRADTFWSSGDDHRRPARVVQALMADRTERHVGQRTAAALANDQ